MRRMVLICAALGSAACMGGEKANTDSAAAPAAATPAPAPSPPAITLGDVAGKWDVKVMPETGDSTLLTYELTATADTTGWGIKFPDRAKPVPVHVTRVEADSIVVDVGPYPSALRKGTSVTTHGVYRLKDGKLVGQSVAHYSVKTADSVRTVRMEGTRKP